jgi:hypothetical protein
MLLDAGGVAATTAAIRDRFPDAPPDIIVIDPIRNLFDGGADGKGENDNAAMLFFLQERVEALRDAVSAEAGLILCHHTKKITKKQLAEDPFQALSGAGALRGFYTAGILMHRPDEDRRERMLQFELRNGPAIDVDPDTGAVTVTAPPSVLPTHYKCPQSGAVLPVENPHVWVYQHDDE